MSGTYTPPPTLPTPGFFGDGSDGALHVTSGTTTLSRYMYYTTVLIDVGATLDPNGWGVYATQSIINNGTVDGRGGAASGATGGAGGSNGLGAMGGDGAANQVGGDSEFQIFIGGIGGDGGASTSVVHAGGSSVGNAFSAPRQSVRVEEYVNFYGAGGGAGGGDATHAGGGGGGGGGYVQLQAPSIVNNGTITVKGGAGAAGTAGTAGGGGGGGGGVVWLVGAAVANPGTIDVSGGAGGAGAGGAHAGADGSAGLYIPLTP